MTHEHDIILPFSEIRAADLPLVGGKGANLGEMTHAGFPVPPGFCLTTAAFQQFMTACPDSVELYQLLDTVTPEDVESVRRVGRQVRQSLSAVPIPEGIAAAVRRSWQAAGAENAFAVRSSATAEDLPGTSFAGQQDTYLNIIGDAALLDAVRRCWVSLFTDRAILYRCKNGFSQRQVQLSVVVQQMVMAEKSGILFTADPLSGHRHTLAIDASFGLGEALVGGLVTPDSYRVDKRSGTIIARQIAHKQVAIFPQKDGGTRQETLSPDLQEKAVLDDQQVLALADLGTRVEAHYASPQDIEWAIAGGEIYLLQARPITSLYPINGLVSPDDSLHIFFSMGHQQNMTRAMTPLSLSSFQYLIPLGRTPGKPGNSFMRSSGGRLFIDVTTALRHPILRRAISGLLSQFDALAPEAFRIAMQRPEFQRPHGVRLSFSALKFVLSFVAKVLHALWWQDFTAYADHVNSLIAAHMAQMKSSLEAIPGGKVQIQASLDRLGSLLTLALNWLPQFVAGEMAKRLITRIARKWSSPADLEAISLGLRGNVVNEMNLALGDLADLARRSPGLLEAFNHLGDDGHAWLEQAAKIEGSQPFMQGWQDFLARYGARGPSEIDIYMPRWYEEPLPLLQVLASYLQKEAGSHRVQLEKMIQAREAAVKRILAGAGALRARVLKRLIAAQKGSVLREHHKFMAVQAIAILKEILKQTAVQLVGQRKLSRPEDIWFLTWAELLEIWDDETTDWGRLVQQRRADLARYQKMTPPMVITSDGETPVVRYHPKDAPPGALVGNPVSSGVIEGVVHVIHDPQKETLNPGEILVAEFTDPGWTPLFINAAGLVLEIGGMMNHGSIVAREYGIPAVVGVRSATTALQSGQHIRLDGSRGIIEIL